MIMLKTLSQDVPLVCGVPDNFKLNMESAATSLIPKMHPEKGLKFPSSFAAATTSHTSKSFCKDATTLQTIDEGCLLFPTPYDNSTITTNNRIDKRVGKLDHHIPIVMDPQRALLHLAKSRAEAEAASLQNNLFQAGFQDCASEVIRFLTEQENLNDGNPLLQGLQKHLHKMSNTICGETIGELDLADRRCSDPSPQLVSTNNTVTSTSIDLPGNRKDSRFEVNNLSPSNYYTPSELPLRFSHFLHTDSLSSSSQNVLLDNNTLSQESSLKRKWSSLHKHELVNMPTNDLPVHNPSKRFCHGNFPALPLHERISKSDIVERVDESVLIPYLPQPVEQSSYVYSTSSSPSPFTTATPSVTTTTTTNPTASSLSSSSSASPSSSILELKAHFLPGIDSNSLASGNFADILLAVESCQSHDNPRVRELANTIINLVHHDDDDDDDDEYDDEEEETEIETNNNDTNGSGNVVVDGVRSEIDNGLTDVSTHGSSSTTGHDDSGIDLGEDWCNPADIIEC